LRDLATLPIAGDQIVDESIASGKLAIELLAALGDAANTANDAAAAASSAQSQASDAATVAASAAAAAAAAAAVGEAAESDAQTAMGAALDAANAAATAETDAQSALNAASSAMDASTALADNSHIHVTCTPNIHLDCASGHAVYYVFLTCDVVFELSNVADGRRVELLVEQDDTGSRRVWFIVAPRRLFKPAGITNLTATVTARSFTHYAFTCEPGNLVEATQSSVVSGIQFRDIACADSGIIAALATYAVLVSTDTGLTWIRNPQVFASANLGINSIYCSASGTRMVAAQSGQVLLSSDSGATWTTCTTPVVFTGKVVMSGDGTTLLSWVASGYLYISHDFGVTWTQCTGAGARVWGVGAVSYNGSKMFAAVSAGYAWNSTDGGATWTERVSSTTKTWTGRGGISADGTKMCMSALSTGYVTTSNDSGVTWVPQLASGNRNWIGVACSADGNKILGAVSTAGLMQLSLDAGLTWAPVNGAGSRSFTAVAMSANGAIMYALVQGTSGVVLVSTDGGVTWFERF
jgi:hypothetical protein